MDILGPLAGGALIGGAASLLLVATGRVAGVSSILGSTLAERGRGGWRLAFLAGLAVVGIIAAAVAPNALGASPAAWPVLVIAGLLVGFGTSLGSGCTSGHGVCGLARLSPRSLVATITFMAAGVITVAIVRAFGGGS